MNKVKNIFFSIVEFILRSLRYACFIYGVFYFLAVILFLNDNLDFDFSVLKNTTIEELKLMLKVMIKAFIFLGIIFTTLEYGYKYLSKSCKISFHKLKPIGKAKEIKNS